MWAFKYNVLLFLTLSFFQVSSQVTGLNPLWAKGSTSRNVGGEGRTIAVDAAGNSYLSGWFNSSDSINFGPYAVHYNRQVYGGTGIGLLAKYSPCGQIQWAIPLPYIFSEPGAIASDAAGNIFTFGESLSGDTTYIFKLDTGRICTWVDSFPWPEHTPNDVTTDANGNVYYAGSFATASVIIGHDTLRGSGSGSYYLAKYSNTGTAQWARTSSSPVNTSQVMAIAENARGDVYIGGTFNRNLVIGNDTLHSTSTQVGGNGFVGRYDTSGNVYWGRSLLSPAASHISQVCTDSRGNVWIYGSFMDSLFYGDSLVAIGQSITNLFVVKLNESGDLLWVRTSSAVNYLNVPQNAGFILAGYQIKCDNSGRTYLSGGLYDSIYTNADSLIYSPYIVSDPGGEDNSFILTYDSNGHIICFQPFHHGGDDWSSITLDSSGYLYFGGDNDIVNGNFILGSDTISGGNETIFIAKFRPCVMDLGSDTIRQSICSGDSVIFGGSVYYSSGYYSKTFTGNNCSDSIVTLDLSVNPISDTIAQSICTGDSFFFHGHYISVAGNYNDTLTNAAGCDSIVNLTLSVLSVVITNISRSLCPGDSITFNGRIISQAGTYRDTFTVSSGCDSVVMLTVTFRPIPVTNINRLICQGDSIIINGHVVTATGIYPDTLITALGCDSIVNLAVTISPADTTNISKTICSGDTVVFNGMMISSAGVFSYTVWCPPLLGQVIE